MIPPREIKTKTGPEGTTVVTTEQKIREWMRVVVSIIALAFGIFVLAAPNFLIPHSIDEGTKRFAAGWIGAVIGYWLP